MRKHSLIAGIAAVALIPSFAFAQQTCEEQRANRTGGTIAGAIIGGVIGSAVAGRGDRATGAVVGGSLGAVIGNQASKPKDDCRYAYGYYDRNGVWHATDVDRTMASGYYDRDGVWVDGTPNGYYDSSGRWVSANTEVAAAGYYDRNNRWVPASSSGYYDSRGQWVAGTASGYYDTRGRWVAGPTTGRYDANGRWISGATAGRYVNGVWVAEAQTGYYDANGRWRAGPAVGYYDTRGRWIATAPSAGGYGRDTSYNDTRSMWDGAPADVRSRSMWLDRRIRTGLADGSLTRFEAQRALSSLNNVRAEERRLVRRHRGLTTADESYLQSKLDAVSNQIRWARRN